MAPPRVAPVQDDTKISLPADFMTGLPAPRRKVKQKRLQMISKNKMETKLDRIKQMQEKFKKEFLKQKNKVDAAKHHLSNKQLMRQQH